MHTPACDDALDWWPDGAPADVDLRSLPAAGAITNPTRIVGSGAWLGIWGDFTGLRIGYKPQGQTFPCRTGMAVPYPKRVDLYLSQTGGTGTVTMARFPTREAALAWAGIANGGGPGGAIAPEGTDVTLGTFTCTLAGGAQQIFLAGTVMPVGGATKTCKVILNRRPDDTGNMFVAEGDGSLAVASNGILGPGGQDAWNVPAGGKLWVGTDTNVAAQGAGARVRS